MRNLHVTTLVLALIGILLTSCAPSNVSLEEVDIPFTGESVMADINGDPYRFFRYETVEQAEADLAKISDDGSMIEGKEMPWQGPVHIYHLSRRIVIYVGSDEGTISTIESIFGRQAKGTPVEN